MFFFADKLRKNSFFYILFKFKSFMFHTIKPTTVNHIYARKILFGLFHRIHDVFPVSFQRQGETYSSTHNRRIIGEQRQYTVGAEKMFCQRFDDIKKT